MQRQNSLQVAWSKLNENLPVSFEDFDRSEADDAAAEDQQQQDAVSRGGAAAAAESPATAPLVKRILYNELSPQQILLRDKIGFVAGISNIALTAWLLAKYPETFYWWYTAKSLLLYGLRFIIYRSKKQHYFMLEMCYMVNVVCLVYIWLLPRSPWLFKAMFGLVAGPLTWSIVALRNSLVLHSLDQMTSLFMHASPALVAWALRWHPSPRVVDQAALPAEQAAAFRSASSGELLGGAMSLYALWAMAYYLKVFVVSEQRIKERNYQTLFTLMTANKNGAVARVVFSVPTPLQPAVYMLSHALLCGAATATAWLCWHSFWYHTLFICAMLLGATWNGSTYYFSIFARKYVAKTGLDEKAAWATAKEAVGKQPAKKSD